MVIIKRFLDILFSILLLIILSPILLIVAILVRINLGSPIIFKQERPGYNAKPFYIYKFRTMLTLKDNEGTDLPDKNRLTRLGIILRKLSLDELPQLINILKGDMSLVGPRPLLMDYIPYYTKEEKKIFSVRPGITGWPQVNGRNNLNWDQRLALDTWYVNNWSLFLDFKIILLTIFKVLKSEDVVPCPDDFDRLDIYRGTMVLENIKFRRAKKEEFSTLYNLAINSFTEELSSKSLYYCKELEDYFKESLEKNSSKVEFYVAAIEPKVIGFVELIEGGDHVFLSNITIEKENRGHGIGKRLLYHALYNFTFSRNLKNIELEVFSNNKTLVWFKKLGFNSIIVHEFYAFPKDNPPDFIKDYPLEEDFQKYKVLTILIAKSSGPLGRKWIKTFDSKDLKISQLIHKLIYEEEPRQMLTLIKHSKMQSIQLLKEVKKDTEIFRMSAQIIQVLKNL